MDKAQVLLTAAGAVVEELQLPDDFAHVLHWHDIITIKEGQASFLGAYLTDKFKVDDSICAQVEKRKGYTQKDLREAYDNCARLRPIWDEIASRYDVVVVPSVPDEAPLGLDSTGDMSFNSTWTVLQCPVVHVPGFTGQHGMPVGLSLVSARFTDRRLLEAAASIGQVWNSKGTGN
jgi:Asp-tRNA(Asn)/Glu-tRNA(Gln) amidotransferase A subunit family amidase